jgi:hypothetical protein
MSGCTYGAMTFFPSNYPVCIFKFVGGHCLTYIGLYGKMF